MLFLDKAGILHTKRQRRSAGAAKILDKTCDSGEDSEADDRSKLSEGVALSKSASVWGNKVRMALGQLLMTSFSKSVGTDSFSVTYLPFVRKPLLRLLNTS